MEEIVDHAKGLDEIEGMLEIGANGPLDKLIGLLKELKGPLEGHSDGLLEELNGLMNGAKLGLVKDEDNGFTKGTKLGLLSHELKGFTKGAELGLILGLLIDANGLEPVSYTHLRAHET